ncbi:hypothetical protein BBP40_006788, partial [Aspergillus hancockii]
MSTPTTPQPDPQSQPPQPTTPKPRLPVQTYHCRFCNHLLLATTRDITSLPRRQDPAKDKALILPLPSSPTLDNEDETTGSSSEKTKSRPQKHYTILLSTTVPDRKATLVRREDGFEKRVFL